LAAEPNGAFSLREKRGKESMKKLFCVLCFSLSFGSATRKSRAERDASDDGGGGLEAESARWEAYAPRGAV